MMRQMFRNKYLLGTALLLIAAAVVAGPRVSRAIAGAFTGQAIDDSETSLAADLSLTEMAAQSELILTGRCLETRSAWLDRSLVTLATVAVDETFKGAPGSTVTVVLPGGIDLNRPVPVGMTYPGAPTLQQQEETFLFLTREEGINDGYTVSGFAQGKFSIVEDGAGRKLVSRDLSRVRLQRGSGVARGNRQATPLAEFKEKVRAAVR